MIELNIISTVVQRSLEGRPIPTGGNTIIVQGGGVDLSDYLKKKVWDTAWELRTTEEGESYIFCKLPFISQYGITLYADGGNIDLPSLYEGIPVDGTTITKREDGTLMLNPNLELGGLDEEELAEWLASSDYATKTYADDRYFLASNFTKVNIVAKLGISDWALAATKPSYKTSEVTEDTNLYFTKQRAIDALADTLKAYVTLKGTQTIEGEKDFTGGLKVNGSPIVYNSENGYWLLQGNLLITGGLTQYVNDGSVDLPNLYDGLPIDNQTIYWDNGVLKAQGGGGGITSITDTMIIEALGYTPYNSTNPNGYITSAALNGYLPKTGGTIDSGTNWTELYVKSTNANLGFISYGSDSYIQSNVLRMTGVGGISGYLLNFTFDNITVGTEGHSVYHSGMIPTIKEHLGLATVATSGSYNDLSNKPTIPTSLKSPYALSWSGYSSGSYDGSAAKSITIPSNTNQLTNGAGFITSSGYCSGVLDYGNTNAYIKIGYTGTGLTASNASHLAAYGQNASGERVIKDISKAEVQAWLGLGSNAYNSTAYLPLSGGTLTGTLRLTNLTEPNGNGLLCYHPTDWTGVTSSQWAVGTGDSQGVIRSSNANLLHYKGSTLYTIWDSGNDGSGSGLDADLLDGTHKSGLSSYMLGYHTDGKILAANTDLNNVGAGFWGTIDNTAYTNSPFNANFGIISMTLNNTYLGQLALPYSQAHNIRYRNQYYSSGIVWSDWKTIAFTTDNVASATKLQTARTIWGQSFDGTGNVSGDLNNVGSIYFKANASYDIGGFGVSARYIYATYLGAGRNSPLQLGVNDSIHMYISTSGNVGIGTTSPAYTLEVNGDIKFGSKLVWLDTTNYYIGVRSNNAFDYVNWYGHYFKSAGTDRMCITRDGLVGIGTTSPAMKLDVRGYTLIDGTTFISASSIGFNRNTAIGGRYNTSYNGWQFHVDTTNSSFNLYTEGTNSGMKATWLTNGNMGLGTTNPEQKLHVNGGCKVNSFIYFAARNGADALWVGRGSSANDKFGIYDAYDEVVVYAHGVQAAAFNNTNLLVYGGITQYSDIRKKTKLQDVELTLSQVANAPLIEHYYNSDDKKTTHVGSIAQYWAEMNDWFCKLDSDGYYTMEIQNAALASAISIARELERYESKTDKKIRLLKKRITELEDEIEKLKSV